MGRKELAWLKIIDADLERWNALVESEEESGKEFHTSCTDIRNYLLDLKIMMLIASGCERKGGVS